MKAGVDKKIFLISILIIHANQLKIKHDASEVDFEGILFNQIPTVI